MKHIAIILTILIFSFAGNSQNTLPEEGLYFDGVDDVVTIPLDPELDLEKFDWTFEIIFNFEPDLVPAETSFLFGFDGGNTVVQRFDNDLFIRFGADFVSVPQDECVHVAFANPSDLSALGGSNENFAFFNYYVNGETKRNDFGRVPGLGKFDTLLIGASMSSAPNLGFFKGSIKEVRIWNVRRSESEINEFKDKSLTGNETGLVGYWKLNDVGQVIKDYSPNGNDGYLGTTPGVDSSDPVLQIACPSACEEIEYFADTDGDGFGDVNNSIFSCAPITGYVINSTDCDDTDALINPDAPEVCDGIDNNCDGLIDNDIEINVTQGTEICPVNSNQISLSVDSPTAGSSYNWSYTGSNGYVQNSGTLVNFQTWPPFDGGNITVQEIGGCETTSIIELTVLEDDMCCENVNADFSTSLNCQSNSINGWANSYWPTNDYEWTVNGVIASSNSNLNSSSLMPGINTVSLKVSSNGFCERTVEKTVFIQEDAVVVLQGDGTICDDQIEVLLVSNLIDMTEDGDPININWFVNFGYVSQNLGDSAVVTLDPSFLQAGMSLGGLLGYVDGNGCYKTVEFDGGTVVSCQDPEVMISPSPFSIETNINIENPEDIMGTIKVSTAWGAEVTTIDFMTNEDFLIGSGLNPGTYFLEIMVGDMVFFERIVKE